MRNVMVMTVSHVPITGSGPDSLPFSLPVIRRCVFAGWSVGPLLSGDGVVRGEFHIGVAGEVQNRPGPVYRGAPMVSSGFVTEATRWNWYRP